jgi:hypothetical protein
MMMKERLIAAALAVCALPVRSVPANADDYVVPQQTLACMDAQEYSTFLRRFGSAHALNAQAPDVAVADPLCSVLKAGETVSIITGKPDEGEVVMFSRQPENEDPHLPSSVRGKHPTYWATFERGR